MAKKRQKQEENTGSWLDTYADMITLLLTFFVLLYASSNLDQQKWQYIYQALKSRGNIVNPVVAENRDDISLEGELPEEQETHDVGDGELPKSFDQLFSYLVNAIEQAGMSDDVSVGQSASNVYLSFQDKVFFGADSSYLLQQGRDILGVITPAIAAVENYIMQIRINGHTADAKSPVDDWQLSTSRAVSVSHFIRSVSPTLESKFSTHGYGHNNPVSDNDTEEGRVKNRRVEIIILRNDVDYSDPNIIKDLLEQEYGLGWDTVDGDGAATSGGSTIAQGVYDANEIGAILDDLDRQLGIIAEPEADVQGGDIAAPAGDVAAPAGNDDGNE